MAPVHQFAGTAVTKTAEEQGNLHQRMHMQAHGHLAVP
jgi:hypothetical protein